ASTRCGARLLEPAGSHDPDRESGRRHTLKGMTPFSEQLQEDEVEESSPGEQEQGEVSYTGSIFLKEEEVGEEDDAVSSHPEQRAAPRYPSQLRSFEQQKNEQDAHHEIDDQSAQRGCVLGVKSLEGKVAEESEDQRHYDDGPKVAPDLG